MILHEFPPMGVYQTLFRFADATDHYLGDAGTKPWAQGYPMTSPVPDGPSIPSSVSFTSDDLRYPQAAGHFELRQALVDYYREFYGASLDIDNIAIFAGGRPGIHAILSLLLDDVTVTIEETEYTPYYDALHLLGRAHQIVESRIENQFRPTMEDHISVAKGVDRAFLVKSNPCNPTGVTWTGDQLRELVSFFTESNRGALIDEAYEFFHTPEPESVLRYIEDIDKTNLFVVGAATKGLQVPGMRVGWVVASKKHVELFRNFSSIAMGGVSRPAQLYVTQLLELDRVGHARSAVSTYFAAQRERYGELLDQFGFKLFTGTGGFYHWGIIPEGLTADQLNERLFPENAAILPGRLCDMYRRDSGPHDRLARFSFGPLSPESYNEDRKILSRALHAELTTE